MQLQPCAQSMQRITGMKGSQFNDFLSLIFCAACYCRSFAVKDPEQGSNATGSSNFNRDQQKLCSSQISLRFNGLQLFEYSFIVLTLFFFPSFFSFFFFCPHERGKARLSGSWYSLFLHVVDWLIVNDEKCSDFGCCHSYAKLMKGVKCNCSG